MHAYLFDVVLLRIRLKSLDRAMCPLFQGEGDRVLLSIDLKKRQRVVLSCVH